MFDVSRPRHPFGEGTVSDLSSLEMLHIFNSLDRITQQQSLFYYGDAFGRRKRDDENGTMHVYIKGG